MKLRITALTCGFLFLGTVTLYPQDMDSSDSYFTVKGSSIASIGGSFAYVTPKEGDWDILALDFGWSYIPFVADNWGPGVDLGFSVFSTKNQKSLNQIRIGPKFVAAFEIPEVPLFPYFGVGYNLLFQWQGDQTGLGHIIKVGFGLIVEPVEHLGIPVEFTINFPVGEDSGFRTYGFSIGFGILGY